jgi:hypothetical protein
MACGKPEKHTQEHIVTRTNLGNKEHTISHLHKNVFFRPAYKYLMNDRHTADAVIIIFNPSLRNVFTTNAHRHKPIAAGWFYSFCLMGCIIISYRIMCCGRFSFVLLVSGFYKFFLACVVCIYGLFLMGCVIVSCEIIPFLCHLEDYCEVCVCVTTSENCMR